MAGSVVALAASCRNCLRCGSFTTFPQIKSAEIKWKRRWPLLSSLRLTSERWPADRTDRCRWTNGYSARPLTAQLRGYPTTAAIGKGGGGCLELMLWTAPPPAHERH